MYMLPTNLTRAWRVEWQTGCSYWKSTCRVHPRFGGTVTRSHELEPLDPRQLVGPPRTVEEVRA